MATPGPERGKGSPGAVQVQVQAGPTSPDEPGSAADSPEQGGKLSFLKRATAKLRTRCGAVGGRAAGSHAPAACWQNRQPCCAAAMPSCTWQALQVHVGFSTGARPAHAPLVCVVPTGAAAAPDPLRPVCLPPPCSMYRQDYSTRYHAEAIYRDSMIGDSAAAAAAAAASQGLGCAIPSGWRLRLLPLAWQEVRLLLRGLGGQGSACNVGWPERCRRKRAPTNAACRVLRPRPQAACRLLDSLSWNLFVLLITLFAVFAPDVAIITSGAPQYVLLALLSLLRLLELLSRHCRGCAPGAAAAAARASHRGAAAPPASHLPRWNLHPLQLPTTSTTGLTVFWWPSWPCLRWRRRWRCCASEAAPRGGSLRLRCLPPVAAAFYLLAGPVVAAGR